MELAKYKACICEGSAETAIIDILLDGNLLIFSRKEMLDEKVLRCRNAKHFEERYLRQSFDGKISVIRILDSRKENFRLSKAYEHKVDVINVVTAPEIEMLIIINEGKYENFKRSGKKPSEYCKADLHFHNVKSYSFVRNYFGDSDTLFQQYGDIRDYLEYQKENIRCLISFHHPVSHKAISANYPLPPYSAKPNILYYH